MTVSRAGNPRNRFLGPHKKALTPPPGRDQTGPKRLTKNPKVEKNQIFFSSNMQNFLAIQKNPFFLDFGLVLTHFWPFYWAWAVGPVKGSRAKKNSK